MDGERKSGDGRRKRKKKGFFSPKRVAQLKSDYDKRAPLRVDELQEAMRDYGHSPTQDELYTVLPGVEKDGRRVEVSFDDFVRVLEFEAKRVISLGDEGRPATPGSVASEDSAASTAEHLEILGAFQSLEDEKSPGFVTASDISVIMRSAGLSLTEEEVVKMCADVGIESLEDNKIEYAAFVKLMLG